MEVVLGMSLNFSGSSGAVDSEERAEHPSLYLLVDLFHLVSDLPS